MLALLRIIIVIYLTEPLSHVHVLHGHETEAVLLLSAIPRIGLFPASAPLV